MSVTKPPYNITKTGLKHVYPYVLSGMKDYTDEELIWEYEVEWLKYSSSYISNQSKIFSDFNDFVYKVRSAPLVHLNNTDFSKLERCTASTYLYSINANEKIEKFKNNNRQRRNVDAILNSIRNNTVTPPIVLNIKNHEYSLFLISGNTRLCAGAAMNYIIPVKLIEVK